jgi:hypothetical protein
MLTAEKILKRISSEPYEFMYRDVSTALEHEIPTQQILDEMVTGLARKRDTFIQRSIFLGILLPRYLLQSITFEEAEKLYRSKLGAVYEEARRTDEFWRKAIEADETLRKIQGMRINPNPLSYLSPDELSRLIVERVTGKETTGYKSCKGSVLYEGVIVGYKDGRLNVGVISEEEYRRIRKDDKNRKTVSKEILSDHLAQMFWI